MCVCVHACMVRILLFCMHTHREECYEEKQSRMTESEPITFMAQGACVLFYMQSQGTTYVFSSE